MRPPTPSAPTEGAEAPSLAALRARRDRGVAVKFLFFWGHRPAPDGRITKSCLSQWFEAPFVVEDVRYPTAEHYMMAAKARLFGDAAAMQRILAAASPGAAKAIGRDVRGFDEGVWELHRSRIVVEASVAKFGQNPGLGRFLLGTGDRVLVEASPLDRVWGIGLAEDDPRAQDPNQWEGLNLLGFALMQARDALRRG